MELVPRLNGDRVVRVHTEDTEDNIVACGAEDGRVSLNVKSPAAVVGVGPCGEVGSDFYLPWIGDWGICNIVGRDDSRDEEHGATVLTCPLAFGELEVREEGEAIAGGIKWGVGCWEVREVLGRGTSAKFF